MPRIDKTVLNRRPAPYDICWDQNKCLVEFLKIRPETPLENPQDYPRGHPLHRSFPGPCRKPFRQESFLNNHIYKVHERKNGWLRTPLRNVITVDLPVRSLDVEASPSSSVVDWLDSSGMAALDSSTELDLGAQIVCSSSQSSSVGEILPSSVGEILPSGVVNSSDSPEMPEMEATMDRGADWTVLPFEVPAIVNVPVPVAIIPPVYRCPNDWCSKEFGRKDHQERHIETCRLFFCHCKKSFVTQKKLSLHQKYMRNSGKACKDDAIKRRPNCRKELFPPKF